MPGEYLVKFKPRVSRVAAAGMLANSSLHVARTFRSLPGWQLVRSSAPDETERTVAALAESAEVEYIEPNFVVQASAIPDDPQFNRQWGLQNTGQMVENQVVGVDVDIDAPEAWDITKGSANVVVAVIDSGTDYTHPDLAANVFVNAGECTANGVDDDGNGYVDDCHGIDTANDDADPMDDAGHGTHVSGTIGAVGNNGIGVVGVAWNVRILPCKFLNNEGYGSIAAAITCLDYIAAMKDRGVNIVASNNSWGSIDFSRALSDAIVAQRQRGILFVAAAGNDHLDLDITPQFPCAFDLANIICVGGIALSGERAGFSNYSKSVVHISAPAMTILSTVLQHEYEYYDGTSMAAPHVTGTIALLAAQNPSRDWRATRNLVIAGSEPDRFSWPASIANRELNARTALTCANSRVMARLRPLATIPLVRAIGAPVTLKVLNINCQNPAGAVTVSVSPGGETVLLADDGRGRDEVAGDGIYSGEWVTSSAGSFTLSFPAPETDVIAVDVDSNLEAGFPVQTLSLNDYFMPPTSGVGGSALVGNIAGDAALEIVATGVLFGPLYAWNADGTNVSGWPAFSVFEAGYPTLAELDGDPQHAEIAVMTGPFGKMQAYGGNGRMLPGWPAFSRERQPPPTADLDGDGLDEVIGFPARRADGSEFSPGIETPVSPVTVGSLAAADLYGDGDFEFIAANPEKLWVSDARGIVPGFPVSDPAMGPYAFMIQPVVGDVDADGRPEIVVVSDGEISGGVGNAKVHIFSNTGKLERTIPVPSVGSNDAAILADLDDDGIPEILLQGQQTLYAWKGDGTPVPGWPVLLSNDGFVGSVTPVVGDVTGDGEPDVVVLYGEFGLAARAVGRLRVFNRDGTAVPGFSRQYPDFTGGMTPAIADIDLDGRNEIVVSIAPDTGMRDSVFVYDLHGPARAPALEWPQYMGGPNHRGVYELGKNLANDAFLTVQAHGAGSVAARDGRIACGSDCIEKYRKGARVDLTAAPGMGATFARWRGACAGQANPCSLAITAYTAVAAEFISPLKIVTTGSGSGRVVSAPSGISCPGSCEHNYPARSGIKLTATAAAGSAFDGWGGACEGTQPVCNVVMHDARTVTARFVNSRTLTVVTAGEGSGTITSSPGALDCGSNCSVALPPGTSVTLTGKATRDSYITDWSVLCPPYINTCQVTLDQDRAITVTFGLKPVLTLSRGGAGSGRIVSSPKGIDCGDTCTAPMDIDTLIELHAIADEDSYLVNWAEACSGTIDVCYLYMDGAKSVAAEFQKKPVLSVSRAGSGMGTVMSQNGGINCGTDCSEPYAPGYPITLTATASAGSQFAGWSGDCAGLSTSCTVTMSGAQSVTATFNGSSGTDSGGKSGGGGALDYGLLALLALILSLERQAPCTTASATRPRRNNSRSCCSRSGFRHSR